MGTRIRKGLACLLVLLGTLTVAAEQLPVKTYTIADGLARDWVINIRQDSHGFLWFCTVEGVSRFDGYTFTNYGPADGLPHRVVNDIVESSNGDYLVGTDHGLAQFDPSGRSADSPFFTLIPLDQQEIEIYSFVAGTDGGVWAGTSNGLYRLWKSDTVWQYERVGGDLGGVVSLFLDEDGVLWASTGEEGFLRLFPDGTIERYGKESGLPKDGVIRLIKDRSGTAWVGTRYGVARLVKDLHPGNIIVDRLYTTKDGLGRDFNDSLLQSSDGRLWVGTRGGLNVLVDAENRSGAAFRSFTATNGGIPNIRVQCIFEDRDNNIWIGAENGGVRKIPLSGFISYFAVDGLENERVNQIFGDRTGNQYVLSADPSAFIPTLSRFDGKRMVDQPLRLPHGTQLSWGWNQQIGQDADGDLWLGAQQGVFWFDGHGASTLGNLPLKRHYTAADGLDDPTIFRLFIDINGDVLFSTIGPNTHSCFHRLDRRTGGIRYYTPEEFGRPVGTATAFVNDPRDGSLWLGFYTGGITHLKDGRFTNYSVENGVPAGLIRHLFFDHENRLWIASALGGVGRVDDTTTDDLRIVIYSRTDGLASNQVTTVQEDRWGQIYLGTGRGMDRLNLDGDRIRKIKHYTIADGLSDNFIVTSYMDRQGDLWFGTLRGVSRIVPQPDRLHDPPSIMISVVNAAGQRQPVSELGSESVVVPDLGYTENQLQIDFFSISYAAGDSLSYQYKFDDDSSDWSAPSTQRSITLANLSPGTYRYLVRAVNSDGLVSKQAASVSFKILSPIWGRWWFIALAVVIIVVLAISFYLYRTSQLRTINVALTEAKLSEMNLRIAREERLMELEKVRTRIATDLHDDIGASLTQIAILSEVAQAQSKKGNGGGEPLVKITEVSNELVVTMSDIVWSINPAKDHVSDLTQRMRRFAADILTLRSIRFHYHGSEDAADIVVKSNLRREVFLIFKESINNIVKHANAKNVWTEVDVVGGKLTVTIRDDGTGFDPDSADVKEKGNGLASMRRRTIAIGGDFHLTSKPGGPTEIKFAFPVENLSATIS